MRKVNSFLKKAWPLRPRKKLDPYLLQQAVRRASRGPRSTLFHLLIPICLVTNFILFYLLPRFIAVSWESSLIEYPLLVYVKWSLPVFIGVNLITYYWARNKLLAPHIKELMDNQVDHQ